MMRLDDSTGRPREVVWVTKKYFDQVLDQITWIGMASELERRGARVTLVSTYRHHALRPEGVNLVYLPTIKIRYLNQISFLLSLIVFLNWRHIVRRPDLVILDYWTFPIAFVRNLLAKFGWLQTRYILDIRTVPVETVGLKRLLEEGIYHAAIRYAHHFFHGITTVVEDIRGEIIERYGIPPDRVQTWGAGVNQRAFEPPTTPREEMRRELGLRDEFVLLYHGIYSPNRGLDRAIQAVAALKETCPDLRLMFLGSGDYEREMRDLARRLGIADRVIFHQPVEHTRVRNFIHAADCGLLPFPDIPWWRVCSPLKMMESLAAGRPVVITNLRALKDILGDSRGGFVAPSDSVEALAQTIEEAYTARDRLEEMGRSGREQIEQKYTFSRQTERFVALIREVLPSGGDPRAIWIVKSYFDINTHRTSRLEMARALRERDVDVTIWTNYRYQRPRLQTTVPIRYISSIHVPFLDTFSFAIQAGALLALDILRGRRPNWVIVEPNLVFFTFPFDLLSRLGLLDARFVLDIRTVPVDRRGAMQTVSDIAFRRSIDYARFLYSGISVITPMLAEQVQRSHPLPGHRLVTWSSAANVKLFDPASTKPAPRSEPLQNRFILMYHGVLSPFRGLQNVVEAMKLLKRDDALGPIHLFLLGDGEARQPLLDLVRESGLEDRVTFQPPVAYEEVPRYVAMADMGVLPFPAINWWNVSSPLKLMEFLAMNRPVLLSEIDAHRQVLRDCPAGYFVPDNRPETLARAMREIVSRAGEWRKRGDSGRAVIENGYTWSAQAQRFHGFLANLR